MNKTIDALKLAEEAMTSNMRLLSAKALAAIREALEEQDKQEPVGVISESAIGLVKLHSNGVSLPFGTPLYAAPAQPVQEPVAWDELCKEKTSDNVDEWQYIEGWNDALDIAEQTVSAEAIRAEALEEAAKVCDEFGWYGEDMAAAIRGLK